MERSRIAVIVPARNEERSISSVIAAAIAHGVPIVVSDGSTDATAEVAEAAGAVVVVHSRNLGYDAALNSGFRRAAELDVEYAVTVDADGQHDPALIPRFEELLTRGNRLVVGIRPRPARISERIFGAYTRHAYGVHDPLCGMKGYAMEAYNELGHFDSYESMGTELMLYALRTGRPFAEVKVPIARRSDTPRLGGAVRANIRIFRSLLHALLARRLRA
jgi:glycosyltransferase involved in cell wall biosynthesis